MLASQEVLMHGVRWLSSSIT